ncbi:putative structure protein [Chaetoceros tenuissimus DNA virus SS12-43V]|uniref:Putative structure protein n=1 Tax=Chaetoceros tenuissimus DNA virus SS12-43V TaxID=2204155 RepID=A0A6J3ZJ60_9VIRU|nr:putative structure protein [Chaetoceros tenuissimus DNA virus SS12-43V]BBE21063.1 putative structure protein [Chaetoceros tenuissimus DNA virus SS12-43V]
MPRRKLTATKRRRMQANPAPKRKAARRRPPMATAKQALAYLHPMAGTGIRPKIHGDSSQLSIGVSNKYVTQYDSDNIQRGETIDIILYPGLNGGMVTNCYVDTNPKDPNGLPTSGPMSDLQFGNGYCLGHNEHGNGLQNTAVPVNDAPLQIWNNTDITSWRQVSFGAKLQLLNTDETNDGWFEAVRFKMSQDNRQMCITSDTANTGNINIDDYWFVHPKLGFMKRELDEFMVQEPSYMRGRLKDIHNFHFNLKHFDGDHPCQMIPSRIALEDMVWNDLRTGVIENSAATGLFSDGGHLNDSISNFNYKTMDCIYIKIHPGTTGSKLLCDVVSNQECVYHPSSDLSQFMDESTAQQKRDFTKFIAKGIEAGKKAGELYNQYHPQFDALYKAYGKAGVMGMINDVFANPDLYMG